MWQVYFKVKGIQPGRVVTPRHGCLDFSRRDIPFETIKELYESGFPYLALTPRGKKKLNTVQVESHTDDSETYLEGE